MACSVSRGLHTWALEICPRLLSLDGWMVPESGHLTFCWSTFVPISACPLRWQIPLRPVTTSTLAWVTGKLLFYTLRARKEGFLPGVNYSSGKVLPQGTHVLSPPLPITGSRPPFTHSEPGRAQRASCTSGSLLHVNIALVRKRIISRKNGDVNSYSYKGHWGLFFLIFICCAGFQFGTQDLLSTVAGRV